MNSSKIFLSAVALLITSACGECSPSENNGATSDTSITPDMATPEVGPTPDTSETPDTNDPPDDGGPVDLLGALEPVPAQNGVSPDGVADVDEALAGEARAGRISDAGVFTGVWAHCKAGDLKLYNGILEACVSSESSNRYEMFKGGGLVDLRLIGSEGEEVFDLYTARIGWNTIHADTVEVVRDGTDGGPAVVRATGTDMPAAYFVGVVGENLFSPQGLEVVTEYRLGPTEDFVEILTYVRNETGGLARVQHGDLLAFGSRADTYRQHYGLRNAGSESADWIAAYGPGHSFAWVTPFDRLSSISAGFGNPPWEITQAPEFVQEDGEWSSLLGRLVVGDGSLDDVIVRARELATQPAGTPRDVQVSGSASGGLLVEAFAFDDTPLTADVTGSNGHVRLTHPEGFVRYEVSGVVGWEGTSVERDLAYDDNTVMITGPDAGSITVEAFVDGTELPASVQIRGDVSHDTVAWGEYATVAIVPGEYTVSVGHGPEYDFVQETVTVTAGETSTVTANLTRVVDTTDWISADFHQHMEPSSDSRVPVRQRLYDNVAAGVEVIVPTDHDVVTDLSPYIIEAGLSAAVTTFAGVETSPLLAHSNVYPLPYQHDQPGRGTVPLSVLEEGLPRRRTVPELIAEVRAMPGDPVFQINHGRDSSGLFDLVDYDPELGPDAVEHRWWSTDFDAMEISNGGTCEQLYDWASLWNAGLTPTGIGSSDSHGVWGQVGKERTYLHMPGLTVEDVTPEAVRDVVRDGRVTLASSAMLEFTDDTLPGDTVTGSTVQFPIRVQSAPWTSVDTIHVIVNGVVTETIAFDPDTATLDYEGTVTVTVDGDSWVVVMASGPPASGAYRPTGQFPYAFNNPIRIDVDGDGFAPPGVGPLDMAALPFCD